MANLQIQLSDLGAKFICNFEGFRAAPYQDSGGLWTIGYGQRITEDEAEKYKQHILPMNEEIAFSTLKAFAQGIAFKLSKCPLAGFTPYQYDALVSLAYNVGINQFLQSTIYRNLIVRSPDLNSWLLYVHDNRGHVLSGLQRRRKAELKLFIYGLYS